MTPKQKADELVGKFFAYVDDNHGGKENAKQCALICVDEVEKHIHILFDSIDYHANKIYWEDVKQEVEKL